MPRQRDPRAPNLIFYTDTQSLLWPEDRPGAEDLVIHKKPGGAKGFYFNKINGLKRISVLAGFGGSFKYPQPTACVLPVYNLRLSRLFLACTAPLTADRPLRFGPRSGSDNQHKNKFYVFAHAQAV